jgi:hypothetical protein
VIAVAVSVVAGVFCLMINGGQKLAGKAVKNPFVRIFAGGCIIIVLTLQTVGQRRCLAVNLITLASYITSKKLSLQIKSY